MGQSPQARLDILRRSGLLEPEARVSFERFARLASSLLNMPTALVTLLDEQRQVFLSQHGLAEPWQSQGQMPLEYSFCQRLLLEPGPLQVNNAEKDLRFTDHPGRAILNVGAYLGIPLKLNDHMTLGALCVIDNKERKFSQRDVDLLKDLADSVVSDIRLRLTSQALDHSQAHLSALLHQAPLGVFELCDRTGIIRTSNRLGERLLGSPDLVGQQLKDFVHPEDQAQLLELDQLWQGKKPRCELEARFLRQGSDLFWGRLHASLVTGEGHRPIVLALLEDITDYRAALEQLVRQSKELEELSLTDPLTGLTNRRGFLSIGKKLLLVFEREVRSAAVIFIDLNDLKKTNDALGHEVGDQMIQEFAQLLRETFRQADLIARLGGDEFAMLAANLEPDHEIALTARLEAQLDRVNAGKERKYRLACALGIAFFDPKHSQDLEALLKRADGLMYADKRRRKVGRL
ncbi:MAG: diguanylate cyclase [Candidatus Eremiobacteraeota bacterium]|nr:diguanylate cyclase [Candidatus Eremiobacteraeota bacterium]MCW5866180.1 diguanylate cyclase [Candidatus Eremiobacteraeota bacterium]